jgi:ABC-type nitrate/sulfonate/bicarbonate transport system permease component
MAISAGIEPPPRDRQSARSSIAITDWRSRRMSVLAFILLWEFAAGRGWINIRFTSQPSRCLGSTGDLPQR